jgi:hypothetical protein
VTFREAVTAFQDPLEIIAADPVHSKREESFLLLAHSNSGRLLADARTERDDKTRIISARPASPSERKSYEQGTRRDRFGR